jgi:hypothetical protein
MSPASPTAATMKACVLRFLLLIHAAMKFMRSFQLTLSGAVVSGFTK